MWIYAGLIANCTLGLVRPLDASQAVWVANDHKPGVVDDGELRIVQLLRPACLGVTDASEGEKGAVSQSRGRSR